MKLTGQCLKDFEKWLQNEPKSIISNVGNVSLCMTFPYNYYQLSNSMQYGVYVDFFDSFGMQIYTKPTVEEKWSVYIDFFWHHILTEYIYTKTRHEARTAAINKAIEIYNEKHSD